MSNGTAYLVKYTDESTEISAAAIDKNGSLRDARTVTTGPGVGNRLVSVLDGLGDLALIGDFTDYSSTEVRLLKKGKTKATVPAPDWCGGEGLTYSVCLLLDGDRMVRTTILGSAPGSGDPEPPGGSVIVTSLDDGSTLEEFGPFPGLINVLPTPSADEVIIEVEQDPGKVGPVVLSRLNLRDGSTTEIGASDGPWNAVCRLDETSVLGLDVGDPDRLSVVGTAQIADIEVPPGDTPRGCSVDGRFAYVVRDREKSTLVRIDLADGTEEELLDLDQTGVLVTR